MVREVRRSVSETGHTATSNNMIFSRSVSLNPETLARNAIIYALLQNARNILQEFMEEYVKIESIGVNIDSPTTTADAVYQLHGLSDLSGDSVLKIRTLKLTQLLIKRMMAALPFTISQGKDYTTLEGLLKRVDQDQLESLCNYLMNNRLSHTSPADGTGNISLPDDLVIQSPNDILSTSVIIRQYFDNCLPTFSVK